MTALALTAVLLLAAGSCLYVPDPAPTDTLPLGYQAHRTPSAVVEYAPGLHADVYPADPHRGTILFLHGGGFFQGTRADVLQSVLRQVSRGWTVVSVDYRLGPEHPFPAAIEDATLAYDWAQEDYAGPVVPWGYSAGAHLAAHVAHKRPVPGWLGVAGFYNWDTLGRRGWPWSFWADLIRKTWSPDASANVPWSASSPPAYLIHGATDPVIHSDESLAVAVASEVFGFPAFYDYVDTGSCQSHRPDCGQNIAQQDRFLDGL